MAGKQTKRERKELAKKSRLEEARRAVRRRRTRRIRTILTTIVVLAAVVGFYLWNKDKAEKNEAKRNATINTAATALGCSTVESPAGGGQTHIQPPAQGGPYTSEPPTSGRHYNDPQTGNGPAFTGVHPDAVINEAQIHNLEHGHIGIQYNPTTLPPGVKTVLEDFTKANETVVFMAPRSNPEFKAALALTAWEKLITCDTVKDDAAQAKALIEAFFGQYNSKAPETFAGQPIPKAP